MKLSMVLLMCLGFGNCNTPVSEKISFPTDPEQQQLLQQVLATTIANHYSPKTLDDSFSKAMFESYLTLLDPGKVFFTKKDIQKLEPFESSIDEDLSNGNLDFFYQANHLLDLQLQKSVEFIHEIFNDNIKLSTKEVFETNPDKVDYAADNKALKNRWDKKIKASVIEELLLSEVDISDSFFNNEKEAVMKKVKQLVELELKQQKEMTTEECFNQFLNTFLNLQDAQTGFLSVEERAGWDASYTRSLVGIGVQLNIEKGYPEITSLTIGGPAWRNQTLKEGDIILKIKEGEKEAVDVFGMAMVDVIGLLKGEEGTNIELTIKRTQTTTLQIPITREAIRFDLVFSLLLKDEKDDQQIGYIRIPRFYTGEEGSAYHVYQALKKIKANKANGIVIDLRNNRGGSSRETVDILGYFFEEGVMMQTKNRDGEINIYEDIDSDIVYNGELVVLVNERSASGSELLSGTLQDFDRAIIVGGNATFGKGTMQRFFTFEDPESAAEIGSTKMTIGTFYTASGRSPQHVGITPDIILPNDFTYVKSGERVYETSLSGQQLEIKDCIQTVNTNPNLQTVKAKSEKRTAQNSRFQLADQKAKHIKSEQDNSALSLNLKTRKAQQENSIELEFRFKKIFSTIDGFQVELLPQDLVSADSAVIENNKIWKENIQQDPYVLECFQIAQDLLAS